jgi:hypothetical protein
MPKADDILYLAVTGGRDYPVPLDVYKVLDEYKDKNLYLVLGDATGVDTFARQWAEYHQIPHTVHKADWETHGRAAGPIRNGKMIEQANSLVAFRGGRGTANCISQARKAGIDIRMVP